MAVRYFGICIGIILACLYAGRADATETIDCGTDDFGLLIHAGSEGFGDLVVFVSMDESYGYNEEDFGILEFKWATGRPPFDRNRMRFVRESDSENKPAIRLDVKGASGKLIFRGRQYQIECDWRS